MADAAGVTDAAGDMATVAGEVVLDPLQGEPRPLEDWVTTFHLAVVALDPTKPQSELIIPTAVRILENFSGSNCRMAWLVAGSPEQAAEFLGRRAEQFLTFADADRQVVKALGLSELPAFVHLNHALQIVDSAQGWDPPEWRQVSDTLAEQVTWSRVDIPVPADPPGYYGTPVGA